MDYSSLPESNSGLLKKSTLGSSVHKAIGTVLANLPPNREWPPASDSLGEQLLNAVLSELCKASLRKSYKAQGLSGPTIEELLEHESFGKIETMRQGIMSECPLLIERLLTCIEREVHLIDPLTPTQSGELRSLATRLAPAVTEVIAPAFLTIQIYQENPEPKAGPAVLKSIALQAERQRLREQSQREYNESPYISAEALRKKPSVHKGSGQVFPIEGMTSKPKGLWGGSVLSWLRGPGSKIAAEEPRLPLKEAPLSLDINSTESLTGSNFGTESLSSSRGSIVSSRDYRELAAQEQAFKINVTANEEIRAYRKAMGKFEEQQVSNEYAKIQAIVYPSEKSYSQRKTPPPPSSPPPPAYRNLSAEALAKHADTHPQKIKRESP